jgi:hypothetical protein
MSETETITEPPSVSPDVCVQKNELFDVEFAKQLADNTDIIKEERDKIKRMLKERQRGNEFANIYKLGKNCKHQFLGRWCSLRGNGLQNLQRDLRAAISKKYYTDVDMVNAQPIILSQFCKREGWDCTNLNKYIAEREELLATMCEEMSIARWEAKEKVVSLLFGAKPTGDMPDFFKYQLAPELHKIMGNVWIKNEAELKWLKKQPNNHGKAMSYILQSEERKCLEAMDRALAKLGFSLDVYIHDGGLVRNKKDNPITDEILRGIEASVKIDTGYDISLLIKPLETSFEFVQKDDLDTLYQAEKEIVEETYFRLMEPAAWIWLNNSNVNLLKNSELTHHLQNRKITPEDFFLGRWIHDPEILTYERLKFAPKQSVAPNEYNLFTKFHVDAKQGDVSKPQELLRLICNHDEAVFEFVEMWLAQMFQRPYDKTKVCIIIQGDEGVGKDSFWDFIGRILGINEGYFFNTKAPENDLFSNFNISSHRAILVKCEEASFTTNKTHMDKLKSMITSSHENYTRKGVDTFKLDDYRNFVMTTNADVPVPISDTNRRFMLIQASSEKRGDVQFWNEMHDALFSTDVQAAYHHYLLNKDITGFSPQKDRVMTEFYRETKEAQTPYHARFLKDLIESTQETRETMNIAYDEPIEIKGRSLYGKAKDFVGDAFKLSETRLGLDLKKYYLENGCVKKKHTKNGNDYVVFPALCREFLMSKCWYASL